MKPSRSILTEEELKGLQAVALEAAANAIFITNCAGDIVWYNQAFAGMSGYEEADILGQNPRIINSGKHDRSFFRAVWQRITAGEVWRGEVVERHKDGGLYTVEQTITPILNDEGKPHFYIAIHEDISQRKHTESRVEYLITHDTLTRLPNRLMLQRFLDQYLIDSDMVESLMAVVLLDLHNFKLVNETVSHSCGDLVLKEAASRIKDRLKDNGEVYRWGSDEFAIVLTDIHHVDEVSDKAEELIVALKQPFLVTSHEFHVGVHMGVALSPFDNCDSEGLIRYARMALSQAKKEGLNRYHYFDTAMQKEAELNAQLEKDLYRAINQEQFEIYYQPQIDLYHNQVCGMEALIRWHHPELGTINPERFIPMAERSGQILELGEWVLRESCHQWKRWQEDGIKDLRLGVNISSVQIREGDLIDTVKRILEETAINPNMLELELTESLLMEDADANTSIIRELRELGVGLAIDDFGTGYSSLSYLKQFQAKRIKIDRSFIRNIQENNDDMIIVRAVIGLGKSLNLEVIAEGVESEGDKTLLSALGCDEVQGFYYSPPLPAEAFGYFVKQGIWKRDKVVS